MCMTGVLKMYCLVQSLYWAHGRLQVKRLDILPMLLQQRHQEIHGQMHVLDQLILSHTNVANRDSQTQNLLHLELDGRLQIIHLGMDVIRVSDLGGELTSLQNKTIL